MLIITCNRFLVYRAYRSHMICSTSRAVHARGIYKGSIQVTNLYLILLFYKQLYSYHAGDSVHINAAKSVSNLQCQSDSDARMHACMLQAVGIYRVSASKT